MQLPAVPRTAQGFQKLFLLCSKLFDPIQLELLSDQTIIIDESSGLIADVRSTAPEDLQVENAIDLRHLTVLPGLVDAHVHLFLHPYTETSWNDQVTKESIVERTIRAVNGARATLLSGFTAVRDLGTEGAFDSDIALRKCMSSSLGLVPGPRLFCATRGIVSTGAYGPKGELDPSKQDVDGTQGADVADGVEDCQKVVRRQIGAGADWIKIYGDYFFRSRMRIVSPKVASASRPLFSRVELAAIIDTAHSLGVKVAAHATTPRTIKTLCELGVDSIEHGYEADREALEAMACAGVVFVPTMAAFYVTRNGAEETWEKVKKTFKMALEVEDLKFAVGGDTGVFAHGTNSLEMRLMHECGMPWKEVLRAATVDAWKCIRGQEWDEIVAKDRIAQLAAVARSSTGKKTVGDNDVPFGDLRAGYAADIIATSGDLEHKFVGAIEGKSMEFVMKAGKVYKLNGKPVSDEECRRGKEEMGNSWQYVGLGI